MEMKVHQTTITNMKGRSVNGALKPAKENSCLCSQNVVPLKSVLNDKEEASLQMLCEQDGDTCHSMEASAEITATFPDVGLAKGTKSQLYHYYLKGKYF